MKSYLIDNGFTPSGRMFDGCMVEVEGTADNPEEFSEKWNDTSILIQGLEHIDYHQKTTTKPFNYLRIMKYPLQLWSLLQSSILL